MLSIISFEVGVTAHFLRSNSPKLSIVYYDIYEGEKNVLNQSKHRVNTQ